MKIESLELVGYKFLALSNIDYIKLTPENKLQLILGTNGSGKSSLMAELSPLPAVPAHYAKEGRKVIEIKHLNDHYELKSLFSSTGNKFHFIRNGEELNLGHTVTVYRELVKKHFGITQDVHDIMLGTNGFHSMSTMERRNWFTKISDADYTFAIQYYQKLKEQLRDVQGAAKLVQSRLVSESEKLLDRDSETKLRQEITELNKVVNLLLDMKTPTPSMSEDPHAKIRHYEENLINLSKQMKSYRAQFLNFENYKSIGDIDNEMINVQSTINAYKLKMDELYKTIDEKQKTIDVIKKANVDSNNDIDNIIDGLEEEIATLSRKLTTNIEFEDNRQAMQALSSIQDHLVSIFISIPDNGDWAINRNMYIQMVERQNALTTKKSEIDAHIFKLITKRKELEHFKEHNQIECPKCSYTWYKGYDEATYQQVIRDIDTYAKEVESVQLEIDKLNVDIEKAKEYLEYQRAFIEVAKSWSMLNPLWKYIQETEMFFKAPRQIITLMENLRGDFLIHSDIERLVSQLQDNFKVKEVIATTEVTNLQTLEETIEQHTHLLHRINQDVLKLSQKLSRLKLYKDVSLRLKTLEEQIQQNLTLRETTLNQLIDSYKRNALNDTINVVKLEISTKEQILSKIDIQKALVNDLQSQLKDYNDKVEVLKIAVKELSPTEGLIAKGLTGFINHFLNQVNKFIKKIWAYPLELLPVVAEDDGVDLDYKFPVRVNDGYGPPDVSKGSSAMKEIIDLAFKVVSVQYLGLTEAPLYLDEPSKAFDSSHRTAMFRMIDNFLLTSNFSQIFMISHFEHCYGCIKNTDITVLCSNNIVLPKDTVFNKAAVIR